ncbi:hypothetical protein OG564_36670 [Streptomyces sp. NBC_01280]|nr:hypothetical protein [Streptomyces sp. NBC_01280]WSE13718.1 hypothetical protein OG518_10570 [Streptomyces sp. NBC_01397]
MSHTVAADSADTSSRMPPAGAAPLLPVGRGLFHLVVAGAAWGTAGAAASLVFRASDLGPAALSF